jgi:hypothetical protein
VKRSPAIFAATGVFLSLPLSLVAADSLPPVPETNAAVAAALTGWLSSTPTPQPTNSWHVAGTPWAVGADGKARPVHVNRAPPGWEPEAKRTDPVFRVYVWDNLGGEPMEIELRSKKDRQFFKVESKLEVSK